MKKALALAALLFAGPAFAWTYYVTPPISSSQCPTGAWATSTWNTAYNCYYTVTGPFADNYVFSVQNEGVYAFEVKGSSLHTYVSSGRGHASYTTSDVITNVFLSDASGMVLQLTDTPYWSHPQCTASFQSGCSPHQTDDWKGPLNLLPGQYNLTITGDVTGNRPGIYSVSIQPPPPPPVQLPLAPLTLSGTVACDFGTAICTLTPLDTSAVKTVSFDFMNNVARLVPAIDPTYTGPLTYDIVASSVSDDGTVLTYSLAGQAVVTDGTRTVMVVFSMDEVIDAVANTVALTNWQVSTQ